MKQLRQFFIPIIPLIFVLLWSTGFIGSKYAMPYAEPFHVLWMRMVLNLLVFALLIYALSSTKLTWKQAMHQMVVGVLVHAGYLGGVFVAIDQGMSAGLSSLIVGLQPLLTAILAWHLFQQSLQTKQWLGLSLGLIGVLLVIYGNGKLDLEGALNLHAWVAIVIALASIATGTLYQKHFGQDVDLVTGSFYQYLSTGIIMGILSLSFETGNIDWQLPLILSLLWLVFGLSLAAVLLLLYMIRENEASRVASYFYLVPPVTAIQAWLLFDEQFSPLALFGLGVVVLGVYLVTNTKQKKRKE